MALHHYPSSNTLRPLSVLPSNLPGAPLSLSIFRLKYYLFIEMLNRPEDSSSGRTRIYCFFKDTAVSCADCLRGWVRRCLWWLFALKNSFHVFRIVVLSHLTYRTPSFILIYIILHFSFLLVDSVLSLYEMMWKTVINSELNIFTSLSCLDCFSLYSFPAPFSTLLRGCFS